jgi:hypothetical protein
MFIITFFPLPYSPHFAVTQTQVAVRIIQHRIYVGEYKYFSFPALLMLEAERHLTPENGK